MGKGPAQQAVERLIEEMTEAYGEKPHELHVDPEIKMMLEREMAPVDPEEYYGVPIYALVRH